MFFGFPYALAGLAMVAGLVAVYLFRARYRRRPVSSLMLWRQTQRPRQGGGRRDRLRLPPLFYLETAAILALLLAALNPHVRRPQRGTLTVVYDPSASMSARDGAGRTAREQAARALRTRIGSLDPIRVRLLRADAAGPVNVGFLPPSRAAQRLLGMPCRDPGDSLSATLARAGEVSDPADEILVLTDRAPDAETTLRPGILWRAFGAVRPNAAITLAERVGTDDGYETLLVEISGFDLPTPTVPLRVAPLAGGEPIFQGPVVLGKDGRGRKWLELPPGTDTLSVNIPPDALAIDNRVVLVSEAPLPLSVDVRLDDAALRRTVERALAATGRVVLNAGAPRLVFGDRRPETLSSGAPWHFVFRRPEAPRWLLGPYLVDRAQPLLEGVAFEGLAWPADTNDLPGRPLVFAGNVPLLSVEASPHGATILHLVSAGAGDALYRSTAWPALVWNVVHACSRDRPGPPERNLRAGTRTVFVAEPEAREICLETPGGEKRMTARHGRATWCPSQPGVYRMRLEDRSHEAFAVNFVAPAESDLRSLAAGSWGGERDAKGLRLTHRSAAWIAGLAALLLTAAHHGWVGRNFRTRNKGSNTGRPSA